MSLESHISCSDDISGVTRCDISVSESFTVRTASLDLASLRTLEEIKEAFSELTKEEVRGCVLKYL